MHGLRGGVAAVGEDGYKPNSKYYAHLFARGFFWTPGLGYHPTARKKRMRISSFSVKGSSGGISILTWFLLPLFLTRLASAVQYEASGVAEQRYLQGDGSEGLVTNWFRVAVSDCHAVIRTGGMTDAAVEFFEYSCDGSNSTLLIKYLPNQELKKKVREIVNEANLFVNTGVVPEYGLGLITHVWLAYASSCFYQRSTTNRTEPVFFMGSGFRENHLTVESTWQLSQEQPRVLTWMCDYSDGHRYWEEHDTLLKERLPPPFDKPATNAFYSVSSWTNLDNQHLPLEWSVVQYKPNLAKGFIEPRITTLGHTLSLGNGTSRAHFVQEMPLRTRVIDKTLEAKGLPIRQYGYLTTNGQLLTLAAIKAQPGFAPNLEAGLRAASLSSRRQLILVVMVILVSFPVVIAVWRSRHRRVEK
jgi:hypothetical protein